MTHSAFGEGIDAYFDGKWKCDCPYADDTENAYQWLEGWYAGRSWNSDWDY